MSTRNNGFILPVVILLSVAISIVGATALQVIVTSGVTLNTQYFNKVANEAARAGALAAASCIESGTTTWTAPLTPDRSCDGIQAGTNYLTKDDSWMSTYSVPTPTLNDGIMTVVATGSVKTLNADGIASSTVRAISTVKGDMKQTVAAASSKVVVDTGNGWNHTCAVAYTLASSDAKAYCWGYQACGRLGNGTGGVDSSGKPNCVSTAPENTGSTTRPSAVLTASPSALAGKTVIKVSGGVSHSCALAYTTTPNDASVYCWGTKDNGQVGDGSSNALFDFSYYKEPHAVTLPGKTFTDVSAGYGFTCGVAYTTAPNDAKVYCWGQNNKSQLGDGTTTRRLTPVAITGGALTGKTALKVSTARGYACAIAYTTAIGPLDAKAYCWGYNEGGQLGNGLASTTPSSTPVKVNDTGELAGKTVTDIATGRADKEQCTGTGSDRSCKDVEGPSFTCAVAHSVSVDNSKLYCWGDNARGVFGNGTTVDQLTPTPVKTDGASALAGKTVTRVSAGVSSVCAVAHPTGSPSQARAYCWGSNACARLGIGIGDCDPYNAANQTLVTIPTPVKTDGASALAGKTVTRVSIATATACVVAYTSSPSDAKMYCWGRGDNGELGDGNGIYCLGLSSPCQPYTTGTPYGYSTHTPVAVSTTSPSAFANSGSGSGSGSGLPAYGVLRMY